ncbi:MAG: hypothetical protein IBX68_00670 [Dehalococcoidia bacterium]|nr:hypothetical protein [Dehalococcoidia bacterium]
MNKVKLLYGLQEIDTEITRKNETISSIRNQLGKDEELVAARQTLAALQKELSSEEREQRSAEFAVSETEKKIASEEKKLYDGSIKNPRELLNLQHEIDVLREQCRSQEERLLDIMMNVDAAQEEAASRRSELEIRERSWQEDQKRLSDDLLENEAALKRLEEQRKLLAARIDPDDLKTYESIRYAKQGLAVAKLVQGRCQGCRISLPVSDQQRARAGHSLTMCSNCGRILYME